MSIKLNYFKYMRCTLYYHKLSIVILFNFINSKMQYVHVFSFGIIKNDLRQSTDSGEKKHCRAVCFTFSIKIYTQQNHFKN